MRVSQISVYNQPKMYPYQQKQHLKTQPCGTDSNDCNVQFKGKFGAIIGGVAGAAAVIAAAIVTAPAAACLAGGGAILGAIGGHVAEDTVNGEKDD